MDTTSQGEVGAAVTTSYDLLVSGATPRQVGRREVLARCRALEARALSHPPVWAVATVQDVRFVSHRARTVWSRLAAGGTDVIVAAPDLPSYLVPGVRCVTLADGDPQADVWSFAVEWLDGSCAALAGVDIPVGEASSAVLREDDDRDFSVVESSDPVLIRRFLEPFALDVKGAEAAATRG